MPNTVCAFCARRAHRVSYVCAACQRSYDEQLGPGWERQDWARDYINLHRRQLRADRKEAARVDYVDSSLIAEVRQAGGDLRVFEPRSEVLAALVLDYGRQGFGSQKVRHLLKRQGWSCSRERIRRLLRKFRDAGLLPPAPVQWSRRPLTEDEVKRVLKYAA